MMMGGKVADISRRRLTRMGAMGEGSSATATSESAATSSVKVPVTTNVTTAVSPIFNISAGNSGGGAVSQSGTTSQTATPYTSNVMTDAPPAPFDPLGTGTASDVYGMPGQSGSMPGLQNADYSSGYDSTALPGASQYDAALYETPQSRFNPKMIFIGLAVLGGIYLLMSPKAQNEIKTFYRTKKAPKKRRKARK